MRNIDRFYRSKWGVFNHFLSHEIASSEEWNEKVDGLDVEKIAKNLHEMGASYYFITIMQGTKYMCAPNSTYDRICGIKPGEACSRRDLIADLIKALSVYDIDLYLYYTGDGPYKHEECGKKMGFIEPRENISEDFVRNWAAVLEEYAIRYKGKVKGWWIDGCYDYFGYTDELMTIYSDTVKRVDPDAVIAFNNGELVMQQIYEKPFIIDKRCSSADYTAGELVDISYIPESRFTDGAQNHLLIPIGIPAIAEDLGTSWCRPGLKRSPDEIKEFLKKANVNGVVVTFDIYLDRYGNFDEEQMKALKSCSQEKM